MKFPLLSTFIELALYSKFLFNIMATPLEFDFFPFKKHSPCHKFLMNFLSSVNQWCPVDSIFLSLSLQDIWEHQHAFSGPVVLDNSLMLFECLILS